MYDKKRVKELRKAVDKSLKDRFTHEVWAWESIADLMHCTYCPVKDCDSYSVCKNELKRWVEDGETKND